MPSAVKRSQKNDATGMTGRAAKAATILIDVTIASRAWTRALRNAAAVCRRAATAVFEVLPQTAPAEVSILLTTDLAVQRLNSIYRHKNKPTNVLSFPASSEDARDSLPAGKPLMLGDVAVAYGVTRREAKAEGKTLTAHLSHLVVHGVLHLLSYDHEHERDAVTMERRERKILATLGISDPYTLPPVRPLAARPKSVRGGKKRGSR